MNALAQSVVLARSELASEREPENPSDEQTGVAQLKTIVDLLTRLLELADANAVREGDRGRFTTEEVAKLLGKRPRTPQKWCRDRQVHSIRLSRDGTYRLTRKELERIRNEGLLPPGAGKVDEE